MNGAISRREFLVASGAGVSALVLPGLVRAQPRARSAGVRGVSAFVSEPLLKPPSVAVTTSAGPSPGYLFAASLNGPGQRGPLILDNHGQVVWFRPMSAFAINFRQQVYAGKPVLTWWEGTISNGGVGAGECVIVDQTYSTVARVQAGNGYKADVHEFLLTRRGTALLTAYNAVPTDMSSVGGPTSAPVLDSIVQEIDVRSGRVVFEWHSLDHVPLPDSFAPLLDPFDYFHVNSIDVDLDGNLLISARNTSAVYKVDRVTGNVIWRLGGRSSDFQFGPGAPFMYQHDLRAHTDGTMTLFDNGPSQSSQESRAIRLALDLGAMRADLLQQYRHPAPLEASAMGNAQVLDGDAILVGWGTEPYFTEFGPTGDVRLDATFEGGAWNYRTFRSAWVGRPSSKPKVAARPRTGGTTVYASWNGSTETAYWQVNAGQARNRLKPAKTTPASGFETPIKLAYRPHYVSVTALDHTRSTIATSPTIAVRA